MALFALIFSPLFFSGPLASLFFFHALIFPDSLLQSIQNFSLWPSERTKQKLIRSQAEAD